MIALPHLVRVVGGFFDLRRSRFEHPLLAKDLAVELLERPARLDPQLVDEQPPARVERLQRISLTAGSVERQHQLRTQALAQRVCAQERLDHRDHLVMPLELELGLDEILGRGQAELFEPPRLVLGEELQLRVRECRPAPEGERLAQKPGAFDRESGAGGVRQALEPAQVELLGLEVEHVARRPRQQHIGAEQLAEL